MTNDTMLRLDSSARRIASHLAPAIIMQSKKASKKPQTFFEEIKSTISCKENRPYIQMDVDGCVENICKTKSQLDYLASKVINTLRAMGIKTPDNA